MIINKINITNFKSISSLEMDFRPMTGLYEITGSVGAGKTTLSEALLFGLFGTLRNKNNRDLIRWGENLCTIDMEVQTRDHLLQIHRNIKGSSSTLDVTVDGDPIIFTNKKDAQKQLENEYYDMSRLIIETLFIISFNNFKSISTMSAQDTKDFLDRVLNLYIITEYTDRCRSIIKDLQVTQKVDEANISSLKKQIDTFNRLRDEIVVTDNDYIELTGKLDALKAKKRKYEEGRTKKLSVIQESITEKNTQMRYKEKCGADVKKNIDFINKKVCPTCGATIDDSKLQDFVMEYNTICADIDSIKKSIIPLQNDYMDVKAKADKAVNDIENNINAIMADITKYNQHKKQIKVYNDTIKQIEESLREATDRSKVTELDILQYNELCEVLNYKVRAIIMNNAIPLINKNIEYYIYKLGLPYSITFDNTFKCTINNQDKTGIPITSLSTGQMKTVDMIIILAVLKALLGSFNMNIIFLDELFSNLDAELRDVMCGILKDELEEGISNGRLITTFLISHSPLNDLHLNGKVFVERCINNNESRYYTEKL